MPLHYRGFRGTAQGAMRGPWPVTMTTTTEGAYKAEINAEALHWPVVVADTPEQALAELIAQWSQQLRADYTAQDFVITRRAADGDTITGTYRETETPAP